MERSWKRFVALAKQFSTLQELLADDDLIQSKHGKHFMDHLAQAINHINVSINNPIDRQTFIDCIKEENSDPEWKYHVLIFFLETNWRLVHCIVLDGIFTFEDLYHAYQRWDDVGYAWGETADWIMEMYYLSVIKGGELEVWRFHICAVEKNDEHEPSNKGKHFGIFKRQ